MALSVLEIFFGQYSKVFALLGGAFATYYMFKGVIGLLHSLRTFAFASVPDFKRYGAWAVVTGATDGIGKAYAQQLAKHGMKIVLISRSQDKLDDCAKEIESKYGVETKTIKIDFSKGVETGIYDQIKAEIQDLDIGVLVNNVGMAYSYPEMFADLPDGDKFLGNMIDCNVKSTTLMTYIVLPLLTKKKKGVIINVASGSAMRPVPMMTAYASTKAFLKFFSQSIREEYGSQGILVQCVLPYFVATKMSGIRKASFMIPGPSSYVASALATVGKEDETFGCVSHAMQNFVVSQVPQWAVTWLGFKIMKMTRAQALKRMQKKK